MTRIVLLSDLHFGYEREELTEILLAGVNRQQADLVVISGDLTHRSRPSQFATAKAFMARIDAPLLVVPGNHDIPLFNLISRFLNPWSGFRGAVETGLSPVARAGRLQVLGLNSVDPYSWRRGKLRKALVRKTIRKLDANAVNIVAVHHPLQQSADAPKELARNAETALTMLEDAGVQVVLSGHLHRWSAEELLAQSRHRRILQIHAGTALCARPGDPPNEFAVLDFRDDGILTIYRHHILEGVDVSDTASDISRFSRVNGNWQVHR